MAAMRAAIVALVLVAILAQAMELVHHGRFNPTRFLAFFTIQSNLLGVAAFIWLIAKRDSQRSNGVELLRGAVAVYLAVTFLVVIFLLSGADVQLQLGWVDVVLHKVFPVVVVVDWLIDPPSSPVAYRSALLWLAYPVIWLGLTLARGAADGWYPYPFLNPGPGGLGQVGVTVAAIILGFIVIAAIVVAVGNARGRTSPKIQAAS